MKLLFRFAAWLTLTSSASLVVDAQMVRITVKNLSPTEPTGLYHSPVWLGVHDGSYDLFDSGNAASPAVEALAELGDSSLIDAAFSTAQPNGQSLVLNYPAGAGPGIFAPGGGNSGIVGINPATRAYLSFAAMIVPSNDSFIANSDPLSLALFDASGKFLGAQTWTFTGAAVWDAGTEVNSPPAGAAFVAGVDAMLGDPEGGTIHSQFLGEIDNTIGLTTPAGTVIGQALSNDPLFSVTLTPVPEPGAYGMIAALGLAIFAFARRRRASP